MIVKILSISFISICLINCTGKQTSSLEQNQTNGIGYNIDTVDSKTKTLLSEVNNTVSQAISSQKTSMADKLLYQKDTSKERHIHTDLSLNNAVSGKVVYMNSYCGGAWPSQEILDSYQQEYPLKNCTIKLTNDKDISKSILITTDNNGLFHSELKPGVYNCFMTKKIGKTMKSNFDPSCQIWLASCFGQCKIIGKQKDGYKIVFQFGCNPCLPPRP